MCNSVCVYVLMGGFFLPSKKSGTSAVRPSASTKIDAVFTQLASHPVPSTLCSGRSHRVDVLTAAPVCVSVCVCVCVCVCVGL